VVLSIYHGSLSPAQFAAASAEQLTGSHPGGSSHHDRGSLASTDKDAVGFQGRPFLRTLLDRSWAAPTQDCQEKRLENSRTKTAAVGRGNKKAADRGTAESLSDDVFGNAVSDLGRTRRTGGDRFGSTARPRIIDTGFFLSQPMCRGRSGRGFGVGRPLPAARNTLSLSRNDSGTAESPLKAKGQSGIFVHVHEDTDMDNINANANANDHTSKNEIPADSWTGRQIRGIGFDCDEGLNFRVWVDAACHVAELDDLDTFVPELPRVFYKDCTRRRVLHPGHGTKHPFGSAAGRGRGRKVDAVDRTQVGLPSDSQASSIHAALGSGMTIVNNGNRDNNSQGATVGGEQSADGGRKLSEQLRVRALEVSGASTQDADGRYQKVRKLEDDESDSIGQGELRNLKETAPFLSSWASANTGIRTYAADIGGVIPGEAETSTVSSVSSLVGPCTFPGESSGAHLTTSVLRRSGQSRKRPYEQLLAASSSATFVAPSGSSLQRSAVLHSRTSDGTWSNISHHDTGYDAASSDYGSAEDEDFLAGAAKSSASRATGEGGSGRKRGSSSESPTTRSNVMLGAARQHVSETHRNDAFVDFVFGGCDYDKTDGREGRKGATPGTTSSRREASVNLSEFDLRTKSSRANGEHHGDELSDDDDEIEALTRQTARSLSVSPRGVSPRGARSDNNDEVSSSGAEEVSSLEKDEDRCHAGTSAMNRRARKTGYSAPNGNANANLQLGKSCSAGSADTQFEKHTVPSLKTTGAQGHGKKSGTHGEQKVHTYVARNDNKAVHLDTAGVKRRRVLQQSVHDCQVHSALEDQERAGRPSYCGTKEKGAQKNTEETKGVQEMPSKPKHRAAGRRRDARTVDDHNMLGADDPPTSAVIPKGVKKTGGKRAQKGKAGQAYAYNNQHKKEPVARKNLSPQIVRTKPKEKAKKTGVGGTRPKADYAALSKSTHTTRRGGKQSLSSSSLAVPQERRQGRGKGAFQKSSKTTRMAKQFARSNSREPAARESSKTPTQGLRLDDRNDDEASRSLSGALDQVDQTPPHRSTEETPKEGCHRAAAHDECAQMQRDASNAAPRPLNSTGSSGGGLPEESNYSSVENSEDEDHEESDYETYPRQGQVSIVLRRPVRKYRSQTNCSQTIANRL